MAKAPKGITHARPKARDEKKTGKDKAPTFPSVFGSHSSMTNKEWTGKIAPAKQDPADPWVILTDERGHYATRKHRLDTGLADPNRCADLPAREQLLKELTGG